MFFIKTHFLMSQTLTVFPAAERRFESMTNMSCTTVSDPEDPPGGLRKREKEGEGEREGRRREGCTMYLYAIQ